MTDRIAGKITLVTGGASRPGLGSAIGGRFAAEGAVVYLTDLDGNGVKDTAEAISQGGGEVIPLAHDVASEADWDRVFTQIKSDHGRLDALVNNAGIFIAGVMGEQTGEEFRTQVDVNLNSVFYGMSRAIALMQETGEGGSIINMSSIVGQVGVPGCGAYGASKGGLLMMSKCAALEHAHENIRINTIHPGMIKTNMQAVAVKDNPDFYDQVSQAVPMKRFGEPEDIANMALFLASDEARYITGTAMNVDGGYTAQ